MKIITLNTLLTFTAFFLRAQTYNYIPFPVSNTTWNGYYKICGWVGCPNPSYGSWTYQLNGDTFINSLTYQKLSSGFYLREDSGKRVYLISDYDTLFQEKLLYDFSLSVGDTMFSSQPFFWIVQSIDTPLYNGIPRRTLHVHYPYMGPDDSWIEGIGSTASPSGWYGRGGNSHLCEVLESTQLIYSKGDIDCALHSNIKEPREDKSFDIYPNPADKEMVIKAFSASFETFSIYDLLGANVKEVEVKGETEIHINTTDLVSGIYLIQGFSDRRRVKPIKILVSH